MTWLMHRSFAALFLACVLQAAQPGVAKTRSLDLQHSTLSLYVYKAGLFAFAADNHEIDAPIAAGSYDDVTKRVQLTIQADRLKVLDPEAAGRQAR